MIDGLTPEQEAKWEEYRKESFLVGTDITPVDKPETERLISLIYEKVGERPPLFIWARSPVECELLARVVEAYEAALPTIKKRIGDSKLDLLWED